MKKLTLAVALLAVCSGFGFAESMAGKIGVGLRADTFDIRYFVKDWLGVHAGTSWFYDKAVVGDDSSEFDLDAGTFYSKEVLEGLMFQTGITVTYVAGKKTGIKFTEWDFDPYIGAEYVYQGRFGFDFKIIPILYSTFRQTGADVNSWVAGVGSLGAHIYF